MSRPRRISPAQAVELHALAENVADRAFALGQAVSYRGWEGARRQQRQLSRARRLWHAAMQEVTDGQLFFTESHARLDELRAQHDAELAEDLPDDAG